MKIVDVSGQRFGRLIAIKRNGTRYGRGAWLCKCDCGNEKTIALQHLKNGTKSCGCLNKEIASERGRKSNIGERSRKHGDFGTKLYGVWAGMKRRCYNPNTKYYADYGGRGISVCDEWLMYEPFKEWALSAGYEEGLSIERLNVDGDYTPENCKWIPLSEQNANKRISIRLEYRGRTYSIKELSKLTGLKERTIQARYYKGFPIDEIVSPILKKNQYD